MNKIGISWKFVINIFTKENCIVVNKNGLVCVYWTRERFAVCFAVRWEKLSCRVMYICMWNNLGKFFKGMVSMKYTEMVNKLRER